ncbi:cytochrome P450 2U1 [Elysia marginata]|uniref:Cytochrome P450 2U1 n=1 Tax=Elysia marginata TaxID=1093978 RepID=A0AAV4JUD2_9GAST|nr:cytochrome P450 2U1 [Elysia marginata]
MHDKNKLNYTMAAIMEAFRLAGSPLGLPHLCREETVIRGYTIPAGTTVMNNTDAIFLSDATWPDPTKFKPERFLDTGGNFTQREEFTPFGIGRRACPAESMARMELFLFLSGLIQRFELQPAVPGELPSLEPVPGVTYNPQAFQVRFVDRRGV